MKSDIFWAPLVITLIGFAIVLCLVGGLIAIVIVCPLCLLINIWKRRIAQIGLDPIERKLLKLLRKSRFRFVEQVEIISAKNEIIREIKALCQEMSISQWRINAFS